MAVPETSPSRRGEINAWRTNKLHSPAPGTRMKLSRHSQRRVPYRERRPNSWIANETDQPTSARKQFSREQLFWHAAFGKMYRCGRYSFFSVFEPPDESLEREYRNMLQQGQISSSLHYKLRTAHCSPDLLSETAHFWSNKKTLYNGYMHFFNSHWRNILYIFYSNILFIVRIYLFRF